MFGNFGCSFANAGPMNGLARISIRFRTTRFLRYFDIEENFKYSYSSSHHRTENIPIDLYHLFLDYSTIIH